MIFFFSFPLCIITSISWYSRFSHLRFIGHFTLTCTSNYKKITKRNNALTLKHCCSHSSFALLIRPAQLTVWSCIVMGCCCRAVTVSVGWSTSVAPAGQDRVEGGRRRLQTLYKEKQHPSSLWLEKKLPPGKEVLWSVNHYAYQHIHLVLYFNRALYRNTITDC